MSDLERVFICLGIAFIVFLVTALLIGPERKARWFRKRKRESFFTKRGPMGEVLRFGRPVTWEGYLTTFIMFGVIGLCSWLVGAI
jgi:hypothetical protein